MTATAIRATERWLRRYDDARDPRCHVVCLPHAGGTAATFRDWPADLPAGVAVHAVQYPGRQDRIAEPTPAAMGDIVGPVADALEPLVGAPLVLFGHSMGACAAYELGLELERRHGDVVDLVVASGSRAPHVPDDEGLHRLPDDDLVAEIRRVNEAFGRLLESPELVELLLPTIRSDYRLIESYVRPAPIALRAPVEVFCGDRDPDLGADDLVAWAACTRDGGRITLFPGDHFYLEDRGPVLAALVGLLDPILRGRARLPHGTG